MQIVKEIETKTHSIDENGIEHILVEKIEQYHYTSEEEKKEHSKEMQAKGFEDNGQVRTNIGSIMQPEYANLLCVYEDWILNVAIYIH